MIRNKYTLLVFWKKEVISTFEIHDKDVLDEVKLYEIYGEPLMRDGFQRNVSIKSQIKLYKYYLNELYKKVKNDEDIPDSDNTLSLCAILCLIKMDQIYNEDEDGICLLRKKKHNKVR